MEGEGKGDGWIKGEKGVKGSGGTLEEPIEDFPDKGGNRWQERLARSSESLRASQSARIYRKI